MELEWEQGRQPAHTAAALAGAFLGAALGADCFLAADHLIGGFLPYSAERQSGSGRLRAGGFWPGRITSL